MPLLDNNDHEDPASDQSMRYTKASRLYNAAVDYIAGTAAVAVGSHPRSRIKRSRHLSNSKSCRALYRLYAASSFFSLSHLITVAVIFICDLYYSYRDPPPLNYSCVTLFMSGFELKFYINRVLSPYYYYQ